MHLSIFFPNWSSENVVGLVTLVAIVPDCLYSYFSGFLKYWIRFSRCYYQYNDVLIELSLSHAENVIQKQCCQQNDIKHARFVCSNHAIRYCSVRIDDCWKFSSRYERISFTRLTNISDNQIKQLSGCLVNYIDTLYLFQQNLIHSQRCIHFKQRI